MKTRLFYSIFILASVIVLSGCASTKDSTESLVLTNVLQQKAIKEQQEQAQQQAMTAAAVAALMPPQESVDLAVINGQPSHPFTNIIPPHFHLIDTTDEYYVLIMNNMKAVMPGVEYVFMDQKNFLTIAIGHVPLKKEYMEKLTDPQLRSEIEKLAEQHRLFYQRFYNTDLAWQIKQIPFFKLEMQADYMHQASMQSDLRYTYFSDPAKRDMLMITGPKANLEAFEPMVREIIRKFETQLTEPLEQDSARDVSGSIVDSLTASIQSQSN